MRRVTRPLTPSKVALPRGQTCLSDAGLAGVACRALRRTDRSVVVWALTRMELVSAIRRLAREAKLTTTDVPTVLRRMEAIARSWTEIDALGIVRERSERLLAAHVLTAADSLQLGAALIQVRDRPKGRAFVTADDRLAVAANAEGFDVIVPVSATNGGQLRKEYGLPKGR